MTMEEPLATEGRRVRPALLVGAGAGAVVLLLFGGVVGASVSGDKVAVTTTTSSTTTTTQRFDPTPCLTAITAARQVIGLYADLATTSSKAITAVTKSDLLEMSRQQSSVIDTGHRFEAVIPQFTAAATRCESP